MERIHKNLVLLQRFWSEGLTVGLIAEPFESVTADTTSAKALAILNSRNWDEIGLGETETSSVHAYVHRDDLGEGSCGDYPRDFHVGDLVSADTPIRSCLRTLCAKSRLFVLGDGGVQSIVTTADLHKHPVRLMLFSAISLLEMAMLLKIREIHPDDQWQAQLSSERLKDARDLYAKRIESKQDTDLLDCLQICDKKTILLKSGLHEGWGFSKTYACKLLDRLEKLRNNLAHAQEPTLGNDWAQICELLFGAEAITESLIGTR